MPEDPALIMLYKIIYIRNASGFNKCFYSCSQQTIVPVRLYGIIMIVQKAKNAGPVCPGQHLFFQDNNIIYMVGAGCQFEYLSNQKSSSSSSKPPSLKRSISLKSSSSSTLKSSSS